MTGETILEPAQEVPLLLNVDIVVVGGGTTGPLAAIAAARQGASVAMVERFGSLGGNLTLGLNTKPSGALGGGLPLEIWDRARSVGAAGNDSVAQLKTGEIRIASPADPEMMKILLMSMCREAGVQLIFEAFVARPVMEDNTVRGVIIESTGGRQCIRSRVVIDCSADGDVAAKAGAPFVVGTGDEGPATQPVSLYFILRNVDLKRLAQWAVEHPDIVPDRAIPDNEEELAYGLWLTGFAPLVRKFQQRTGTTLYRENITLKSTNGELYVNATRVRGASGLSPLEISDSIVACYRQIACYAQFLKEDIPGFENSRLGPIAPVLGVRETRHILGGYVLSGHDVTHGEQFEDSVMADMSANDIHDVKGAGCGLPGAPPLRDLLPLFRAGADRAASCRRTLHFGRSRRPWPHAQHARLHGRWSGGGDRRGPGDPHRAQRAGRGRGPGAGAGARNRCAHQDASPYVGLARIQSSGLPLAAR